MNESRQRPSIGRIVHYVAYRDADGLETMSDQPYVHRAAIVTDVAPDLHPEAHVTLTIFHPDGFTIMYNIEHDASGQTIGTWHFPEHVSHDYGF